MQRVKDKIAIITGGARGIGAATAKLFIEHGATVIIVDILKNTEQYASSIGAEYVYMDVSDESAWLQLSNTIKKSYGKLDILFNNAAITGLNEDIGPQDPENITLQSWHQVHSVNLDSVMLGCKHAIALMKQSGGSIINMSSRSAMVGIPAASAYASSKAAVRNHTKSVALYVASQGYKIRCNSLHPGAILTPMWDPMLGSDPETRDMMIAAIAADIPLATMGEAIDVAYAALYLASDESKYVTGIELTVDGGILAGASAAPKNQDD